MLPGNALACPAEKLTNSDKTAVCLAGKQDLLPVTGIYRQARHHAAGVLADLHHLAVLQITQWLTCTFHLRHRIDIGRRQIMIAEELRQRFTGFYPIRAPLLLYAGGLLGLSLNRRCRLLLGCSS